MIRYYFPINNKNVVCYGHIINYSNSYLKHCIDDCISTVILLKLVNNYKFARDNWNTDIFWDKSLDGRISFK